MLTLDFPLSPQNLRLAPEAIGDLQGSTAHANGVEELRRRGLLNREKVQNARRVVPQRLPIEGYLNASCDPMDAAVRPGAAVSFLEGVADAGHANRSATSAAG
jgi:hypothetical protein